MTAHMKQPFSSQAAQQTTATVAASTKHQQPQPQPQPRRARSRSAPHPNSVLDRRALIACLEKEGLYGTSVQPMHVTGFYQSLHRQHYPELPDFVANYYKHEAAFRDPLLSRAKANNTAATNLLDVDERPLKNKVTNKKNRNKVQLPKAFLHFLSATNNLVTVTSSVAQQKTSKDGSTTKLAIRLHDGQLVESVLMRYTRARASGSRASLCVSSQCGCAMGCTFCATGTMGLSGNMTSGEILEQVVHADRILAEEYRELKRNHTGDAPLPKIELVRNIVFMGMGEPLDNYKNVVEACRALIDNKRWNFAHGRVTVSTVGIVDKIRKLSKDLPEVSLALSLHAPNQAMRSAIVPTAKHFPIEKLIDALDEHMMTYLRRRKERAAAKNGTSVEDYTVEERIKESTRRRAMIEYVMLEGETSTFEAAHQLGKLCEGRQLVVNLIPYNKTDVKDKLSCPSHEHMEGFRKIVSSYSTFCTVRRTMGADIDSACGQLVTLDRATKDLADSDSVQDIEDAAACLLNAGQDGGQRATHSTSTTRQQKVLNNDAPEKTEGEGLHNGLDLDRYILPLAVATTLAAVSFMVSSVLFLKQRRR